MSSSNNSRSVGALAMWPAYTKAGLLASAVRSEGKTDDVTGPRATKPFVEELPELLEERGMSLRRLAQAVGVGDDHLSRVLRGARSKRPTADLARRVAAALELPDDYFVEARLDFVVQQLSGHQDWLDETYDELRRRQRKTSRRRKGK